MVPGLGEDGHVHEGWTPTELDAKFILLRDTRELLLFILFLAE